MSRFVLLLLAALVLQAAPASAQTGRIVASAGGFDLYARHGAHGGVCLAVLGPSDASGGSQCQRVFSPFHPAMTFSFGRRAPVAVAVPPAVARLTAGGRRSVDTIAVDGFAVRFALLADVGRAPLLRFYDAGGALVGAARSDFGSILRGGTTVFSAPGTRLRVRRSFDLEPSPLDFDRTVPTTCLTVGARRGGTAACTRDRDLGEFDMDLAPACAPARPLLYGLVADRVRRVVVVLGDGRSLVVPTRTLAAGLGPSRLVAAPLPSGLAVRSVRGLDAAGRTAGRRQLGAAPSGLPCPREGDSVVNYLTAFGIDTSSTGHGPIADPVVVAQAGGRSLRAADGSGAALCTGTRRRLGCATPPVDAEAVFPDRRGNVVTAVVSADVASVSFALGDGTAVEAATSDGAAYTGRYAGRVRFLAAALPPGAIVERAIPRDAAGRRVGTAYVGDTRRPGTTSRRRFAPGVQLVRSSIDVGDGPQLYACLRPRHARTAIGRIGLCGARPSGARAIVSVGCAPRRAVAIGALPRAGRIRLHLTGGVTLRPRVRRVQGIGRVWTAVLPRGRGLIDYRAGRRTHSLAVPPAREQCGYENVSRALL